MDKRKTISIPSVVPCPDPRVLLLPSWPVSRHCRHFGQDNSLLWGAVLCTLRRLAASLASSHWMSIAHHPQLWWQKYLQILTNVLLEWNYSWMRTKGCMKPSISAHFSSPGTMCHTRIVLECLLRYLHSLSFGFRLYHPRNGGLSSHCLDLETEACRSQTLQLRRGRMWSWTWAFGFLLISQELSFLP